MTWNIEFLEEAERVDNLMKIIVISARTDEQVYHEASKRRSQYGL